MSESREAGLVRRLELVRDVLARSPDPLDAPFAIQYAAVDGQEHLDAWKDFAERAGRGEVHGDAVLYVHLPFCARLCTYCLLSASRTPGKAAFEGYLRALHRQIRMVQPAVGALRFSSLHVGGGTPTLLSEPQLDELLGELATFRRADGFQIGIEAHPATASASKMAVLAKHGVHRVSFGVESLTPAVLDAVNRGDQTRDRVRAAVRAARGAGLSVNLDLLAGLPQETEASFQETVRGALELEPDSMSVNRFLAENSELGSAGLGDLDEETRRADRMLLDADRILRDVKAPRWPPEALATPGYGTQYVWDTSDRARGYFQQDMIGPSSTLALGHGGMGHMLGSGYSIAAGSFTDYVGALERDRPPPMLVHPVTLRFEMAFFLADRACRDSVSPRDFARVFRRDAREVFDGELRFLVSRGLLRVDDGRVRKPANRAFQVTHLLAFLALDEAELSRAPATPALPRAADPRRQYDAIGAELPPSLLWCRMAIRASRAGSAFVPAE